jgi:hypothetical protein
MHDGFGKHFLRVEVFEGDGGALPDPEGDFPEETEWSRGSDEATGVGSKSDY